MTYADYLAGDPVIVTAALPGLLASGPAQLALVACDWRHFAQLYRSRRATSLFDELAPPAGAPSSQSDRLPPAATPAAAGTSADALRDWLAGQLGAALRIAPERIDPDTPMTRQGLDSLLAIDLRNRIEREIGLAVALKALMGTRTLAQLARMLADEAQVGSEPAAPAEPSAGDDEWISGEL